MSSSMDNMRFQQLVFRTIPHSLVEWLDTELEKRNVDSVYTHLILSILQADSDNTEPEECIDLKHNRQKIYHQYRKPEGLYSSSKSKHQKLRANRKHILSTPNISSSKANTNLERKKRIAAITCLKSVSDDATIEDLIDEVCLRLKNVKNKSATKEDQSEKNLDVTEENMPFYIPPSSPTDQVQKYFAAFPPLNTFEEQSSDQFIHAWSDNCFRKEKDVQSILQNKYDNSFGSLKSIENLYPPGSSKSMNNRYKVSNLSSKEENTYNSSDENMFSKSPVNYNNENIDNDSENIFNSKKIDYGNDKNIRESTSFAMKCKSTSINKSETDSKRKIASNSSSFLFSNSKKVSKTCSSPAAETTCSPFKKFKSSIKLKVSNANIYIDTLGQLFDSVQNSDDQLYEEKELTEVKALQRFSPVIKRKKEILNERNNLKDSDVPDENMDILDGSFIVELRNIFLGDEKTFDKSIRMIEWDTILKRPCLRARTPILALRESNAALIEPKAGKSQSNQFNKDDNFPSFRSKVSFVSRNTDYFNQKNAHDNIAKTDIDERRQKYGSEEDISQIKFISPSYEKIPHHRVYIGGMNLIKIGPKYFYNFNILKALNYFSEQEIFNIMTVGDFHQINDFLSLFCTPNRHEDSKVVSSEVLGNSNQSCQKSATNDNFHSQLPHTGIQYSPSYFLCKETLSKEQPSTLPLATVQKVQSLKKRKKKFVSDEEIQYENYYKQKKMIDMFKVYDKNEVDENNESNLFDNLPNEKVDDKPSFSKGQVNESQPFLPANDYNIINNLSGKECCGFNICDMFISGYNVKADRNLPPAATYSCQHANQCNFFSCKKSGHKNGCSSLLVEKNNDSYLDTSEISGFKDIHHCSSESAFKQYKKNKPSFKNSHQSLLKKAINVDRVIQKINGKERVTTSSEYLPSTELLAIGEKCKTHTPKNVFYTRSSFMTSDDMNSNNSLLCENSLLNENTDIQGDWQEQFENLKSLWKCETSNSGGIWQKPVDSIKNENFPMSSDTTNIDLIKNKINEEHDELLKELITCAIVLKEESSLPHSSGQNVSQQVDGCPYKINVKNDSSAAEISDIQLQDITTQNVLNSNNDFSLYVPQVHPSTHLSKDNFQNESADLEMFGSNIYSMDLENQTFQETDFMKPSAFEDPCGIYGKNENNHIEGCGWSLNSDDFMFKTDEYGDQSFQNFGMLMSEQENFQYMQLDEQQFAFEEDGMLAVADSKMPAGLIFKRLKHKYPSSFKKPCSYFLEGNCNRSDCKYTHDLSTITCRFWIHGSCFKGSSCPFLHGFNEEPRIEETQPKIRKKEPKSKYSLESEADFPSLSSPKNDLSTSKSEPVDIVRVKRSKNSKQ